MKRVTITDVAQRAGVSKSTVSHVINETRFVEVDTRLKVLQAIGELGYRPSGIARSLVSQRTRTAGLLISDVGNPFYHEVIMGVEEVALSHGYSVFLCNTNYDLDRGMKLIQSLIDKSVDGVLFMSSSMTIEMVQEVLKNQVYAVVLDWGNAGVDQLASTLTINFDKGTQDAVRHLVALGHREIGYISGPLSLWTAQVRKDAFFCACAENGLDPERAFIMQGNLRVEGGHRAFDDYLKREPRPTAVVAANDLTAIGFLLAAQDHGLSLPRDVSIVGLDDIDLASRVTPPLTTISLPRYEIGMLAMQMLLEIIDNPARGNQQQEVATSLVVRESTARVAEV